MNRVVLVTGAGTGIGKSAALALLKDGYCVGLVGRRRELLEKTAAESGAPGSTKSPRARSTSETRRTRRADGERRAAGRRFDQARTTATKMPFVVRGELEFERTSAAIDTRPPAAGSPAGAACSR